MNQERAAGQRDASQIKTLTDKEEALLASIRSQLLGGGKGKGTKSGGGGSGSHQGSRKGKPGMGGSTLGSGKDKAKPVNTVDGVRRYDDLDDLEDDEDEEGGEKMMLMMMMMMMLMEMGMPKKRTRVAAKPSVLLPPQRRPRKSCS